MEGTVGEISTCETGAVSLKRERVSPLEEIPAAFGGMDLPFGEEAAYSFDNGTNTEITQETTTESSPVITTEINSKECTNPIISYQAAEELFKYQTDYDAIWMDRPHDRKLLDEIVSIAVYKKIDKFAVEFVMDSLRSCGSKAVNIRAVILTSLYNAVMTTTSYFTNLYAYHSANPQSIRG